MGGPTLGDHLKVPGTALERWDCAAPPKGPWSVVIRAAEGHFGVHGAVVTFPVDQIVGRTVTRPQGGVWDAGTQRHVWPLSGSRPRSSEVAQGRARHLTTFASLLSAAGGTFPYLLGSPSQTPPTLRIPCRPRDALRRYGSEKQGSARRRSFASSRSHVGSVLFESLGSSLHARPAGFVRGNPAIYPAPWGKAGTLAWGSPPRAR